MTSGETQRYETGTMPVKPGIKLLWRIAVAFIPELGCTMNWQMASTPTSATWRGEILRALTG